MATGLVQDLVLEAQRDTAGWDGGAYKDLLVQGLRSARPNFETDAYRRSFREHAVDRRRFASVLASNLYMEGYSAGRLKQYAGTMRDGSLRRDLMRHAQDEARHSRHFLDLLFLVFPDLDTPTFRQEAESNVIDLDAVSPCPLDYPAPSSEELLNSLILMNLFEVKALFLANYLKPFAQAHAPVESAQSVRSIVEGIAQDERHHIAYTSRHIDAHVREMGSGGVADLISGFIELMNGSDDFHF